MYLPGIHLTNLGTNIGLPLCEDKTIGRCLPSLYNITAKGNLSDNRCLYDRQSFCNNISFYPEAVSSTLLKNRFSLIKSLIIDIIDKLPKMRIQTDLKWIEQMGVQKERENFRFRSFLKQMDMTKEEIDDIVHEITALITTKIDCTQCANCCKQIEPVLSEDDILRFSKGLGLPSQEFKEQYLKTDVYDPSNYLFIKQPCPFLKDNLCTNYEYRPAECQSFPHLQKDGFIFRLWGIIENYEICPIVFNVYEWLKAELWEQDNLEEFNCY